MTFLFGFWIAFNLMGQAKATASDFEKYDNTSWEGNLMYVNYGDGKEMNLRTTMQLKVKNNTIYFDTQYTDEPSANGTGKIKIRKDGRYFGKEEVIEKEILENGDLKVVTRFEGKDDNKTALIKKTYVIGDKLFSITKKVIYKKSDKTILRNKITYNRLRTSK